MPTILWSAKEPCISKKAHILHLARPFLYQYLSKSSNLNSKQNGTQIVQAKSCWLGEKLKIRKWNEIQTKYICIFKTKSWISYKQIARKKKNHFFWEFLLFANLTLVQEKLVMNICSYEPRKGTDCCDGQILRFRNFYYVWTSLLRLLCLEITCNAVPFIIQAVFSGWCSKALIGSGVPSSSCTP